MAQQAVGDGRAAAPWRPHGRHELHVGQRAECRVAPVPATLANGLTQELQWRLHKCRDSLFQRLDWWLAHELKRHNTVKACFRVCVMHSRQATQTDGLG